MQESLFENGVAKKAYANNSDTLFVWFGGINEPFFSENFARESGFDCLYFIDKNYNWYTEGLAADGYGPEEFVAALTDICRRYRYVSFAGQSSGGYASLYYARRCNVDLVIAFAPQTRNLFDGQCGMTPKVRLADIYDLYSSAGAAERPAVLLNISRSEKDHHREFQWHDREQIAEMATLDRVTVVTHPYDNHAVSVLMRHDAILYRYLAAMVSVYQGQRRA
ncbi:hypothetical protein C7410_12934 [Paraburkholderia silvatlantica]|uniref:Alpha/beta hydrolase n=1 Tax=Paraburkholderia silvatlantica TaxID=321895 RepID=A0A2V4TLP0_9BURK|nr:hypothetical protein [Paraburkholderia silvatlantica]PYE16593.1 hypothetical protein C7410_12934 [Paraburkholderia silvatlantica]